MEAAGIEISKDIEVWLEGAALPDDVIFHIRQAENKGIAVSKIRSLAVNLCTLRSQGFSDDIIHRVVARAAEKAGRQIWKKLIEKDRASPDDEFDPVQIEAHAEFLDRLVYRLSLAIIDLDVDTPETQLARKRMAAFRARGR